MPVTSYTVTLYAVTAASGPFPMTLPDPTDGTTWIIRDVCFYFPSTTGLLPNLHQANVTVGGNQIASTPAYRTVASMLYEIRDIRQTVHQGEEVQLHAIEVGWNLQITGYAFASR